MGSALLFYYYTCIPGICEKLFRVAAKYHRKCCTANPKFTEVNDVQALLYYAQAVLQTIHQIRVCRRCQTQIALLRRSIGAFEQEREAYARAPHQGDPQHIDTFLDEMVEQLQPAMERICGTCRRRMERLTWELLVDLLLEEKRQEES